jgi:TonB family protein
MRTVHLRKTFLFLATLAAGSLCAWSQNQPSQPTTTPTPGNGPSSSQSGHVVELPAAVPKKIAPSQPPPLLAVPSRGGIEILSDTGGVDFGPYMKRMHVLVQAKWNPLIPTVAFPPMMKSGTVTIQFAIMKDGQIKAMKLEKSSGDESLDRAAWGAITTSNPLPPLPAEFPHDFLLLRCGFVYNQSAEERAAMQQTTRTEPDLKPVIENDRVLVWDVADSIPAQPLDAVVVSVSGSAMFLPKGTPPKIAGRSIVIDLKDHPVAPIENTSGYPLAFPRPGVKKILENDRVIVWDYTWTPGVPTPMHFHDKDVVVLFLEDGDLKSTTLDGQSVVNSYTPFTVRFNARNRTHTETLVRGQQRAIITELK